MIGTLVVTHGKLATELVNAAKMIVGELANMQAISIGWNDDVNEARERIRSAIKQIDHGSGVLILTDMFGGTPSNLGMTFLETDQLEVITGVNLPMLIKLAGLRGEERLSAVEQKIRAQGQKSIYVASEVLVKQEG